MGTRLGVDRNIEAALSYLLGWITGVLFFVFESDGYVRFHAAQSVLLFGGLYLFNLFLRVFLWPFAAAPGPLSGLLFGAVGLVSTLVSVAGLALWLLLMYKAYTGERYRLPFVGELAERYS